MVVGSTSQIRVYVLAYAVSKGKDRALVAMQPNAFECNLISKLSCGENECTSERTSARTHERAEQPND